MTAFDASRLAIFFFSTGRRRRHDRPPPGHVCRQRGREGPPPRRRRRARGRRCRRPHRRREIRHPPSLPTKSALLPAGNAGRGSNQPGRSGGPDAADVAIARDQRVGGPIVRLGRGGGSGSRASAEFPIAFLCCWSRRSQARLFPPEEDGRAGRRRRSCF